MDLLKHLDLLDQKELQTELLIPSAQGVLVSGPNPCNFVILNNNEFAFSFSDEPILVALIGF